MTRKQKRLALIGSAVGLLGLAIGLVLYANPGSVTFFASPTELAEKKFDFGTHLRIGGLVKDGTLVKGEGYRAAFVVTDTNKDVKVEYIGNEPLPDLFQRGARGRCRRDVGRVRRVQC